MELSELIAKALEIPLELIREEKTYGILYKEKSYTIIETEELEKLKKDAQVLNNLQTSIGNILKERMGINDV